MHHTHIHTHTHTNAHTHTHTGEMPKAAHEEATHDEAVQLGGYATYKEVLQTEKGQVPPSPPRPLPLAQQPQQAQQAQCTYTVSIFTADRCV